MTDLTVWLCLCCTLVTANGECCDDEHSPEPLSAAGGDRFALGMVAEDHDETCARRANERAECDTECERDPFRRIRCAGCGQDYAGEVHAAVQFTPLSPAGYLNTR